MVVPEYDFPFHKAKILVTLFDLTEHCPYLCLKVPRFRSPLSSAAKDSSRLCRMHIVFLQCILVLVGLVPSVVFADDVASESDDTTMATEMPTAFEQHVAPEGSSALGWTVLVLLIIFGCMVLSFLRDSRYTQLKTEVDRKKEELSQRKVVLSYYFGMRKDIISLHTLLLDKVECFDREKDVQKKNELYFKILNCLRGEHGHFGEEPYRKGVDKQYGVADSFANAAKGGLAVAAATE